jgi:hypothetical protein
MASKQSYLHSFLKASPILRSKVRASTVPARAASADAVLSPSTTTVGIGSEASCDDVDELGSILNKLSDDVGTNMASSAERRNATLPDGAPAPGPAAGCFPVEVRPTDFFALGAAGGAPEAVGTGGFLTGFLAAAVAAAAVAAAVEGAAGGSVVSGFNRVDRRGLVPTKEGTEFVLVVRMARLVGAGISPAAPEDSEYPSGVWWGTGSGTVMVTPFRIGVSDSEPKWSWRPRAINGAGLGMAENRALNKFVAGVDGENALSLGL